MPQPAVAESDRFSGNWKHCSDLMLPFMNTEWTSFLAFVYLPDSNYLTSAEENLELVLSLFSAQQTLEFLHGSPVIYQKFVSMNTFTKCMSITGRHKYIKGWRILIRLSYIPLPWSCKESAILGAIVRFSIVVISVLKAVCVEINGSANSRGNYLRKVWICGQVIVHFESPNLFRVEKVCWDGDRVSDAGWFLDSTNRRLGPEAAVLLTQKRMQIA